MQSLFSFVVLLLTAVNCVTAQKTSPRQCAKGVHIISGHAHQGGPLGPDFPVDVPSIPGTPFEKRQDPNVAGFGTLYPLFSAIRTAIPGTTNYTTPFPSYIAARVSQVLLCRDSW